MARHNRDAHGSDQRGFDYEISYQPDWLRLIKVTRTLESLRQSTKTLFRSTSRREQSPGPKVRTRISCAEQNVDVEIDVNDPNSVVKRIIIVTAPAGSSSAEDELEFSIEKI
ncbi:MAG TPA: hypothetical protein VM100_06440 [Longimicrobiales bacterium]|nr:hypothetical protein [Longimicrobiales bacterium]